MTVAIMDLGTNTFHLLIAKVEKHDLQILYKSKIAVKLGENGISAHRISAKPFKRGVSAMKRFGKIAAFYQPEKIIAVGTAAIRNALNKKEFLNAIEKESGIRVKVISGIREAQLIYEGARQAIRIGSGKTLIMDIGGGSVEFIIADGKKIFCKHSFELGAALLLEQFKPDDPLKPAQLKKIRKYLGETLQPLFDACEKYQPDSLTGSSGSFDTFAEMISYRFYKPGILRNATTYEFKMEDYYAIYNLLLFSTTAERTKMKGLIAMRIDMIVIAAIILTFVLEKLNIKKMKLSTYALKEGVLYKLINNKPI